MSYFQSFTGCRHRRTVKAKSILATLVVSSASFIPESFAKSRLTEDNIEFSPFVSKVLSAALGESAELVVGGEKLSCFKSMAKCIATGVHNKKTNGIPSLSQELSERLVPKLKAVANNYGEGNEEGTVIIYRNESGLLDYVYVVSNAREETTQLSCAYEVPSEKNSRFVCAVEPKSFDILPPVESEVTSPPLTDSGYSQGQLPPVEEPVQNDSGYSQGQLPPVEEPVQKETLEQRKETPSPTVNSDTAKQIESMQVRLSQLEETVRLQTEILQEMTRVAKEMK